MSGPGERSPAPSAVRVIGGGRQTVEAPLRGREIVSLRRPVDHDERAVMRLGDEQRRCPGGSGEPTGGSGKMVLDVMHAGGLVVAGTDTPNGINLHGELMAYVMAGMSNYEALQTATVNPAQALGFDGGTIAAGKLADLVMVDGDPLANIANAYKVKRVIANGRLYELHELVNGPSPAGH